MGHSRRQAHRNASDNTRWRQPDLDGVEHMRAELLRSKVQAALAEGLDYSETVTERGSSRAGD